MKVSQSYEAEVSITASTPINAPINADLRTIGGYLRSVYFATDDPNASGNVYYRILCKGTPIFPGGTSAPINTNVPQGWAAAPARVIHDLNINMPDSTLRIEFINYHTSAVKVYLLATVQLDTLTNLIDDMKQSSHDLIEVTSVRK